MPSSDLALFYNVENFFPPDIINSGAKPSGIYNWSPYKYGLKVNRINNVFRFINEDFGQIPMLIGLAEIGSLTVLEDLKNTNSPISNYETIYEKSPDLRGLSVALLFDPEKLNLIEYKTLNFQLDTNNPFPTRDILQATFTINSKKLHVFVLHLPSKREGNIKKKQREYILTELKNSITEITKKRESVIIMGDFNEDPNEESLKNVCDNNGQNFLTNPFEAFYYEKRYTSFHHKNGVVFDQIIFSEEIILRELNYKSINAEIYNSPRLRNKDHKHSQYPLRTHSGSRYLGGYSDHFPVLIQLVKD